jgi:hypothetical protein
MFIWMGLFWRTFQGAWEDEVECVGKSPVGASVSLPQPPSLFPRPVLEATLPYYPGVFSYRICPRSIALDPREAP